MKAPDAIATRGIHETEILRLLGKQARYRGDGPVFETPLVLLGFNNRSGSNLLASHIRSVRRLTGFHEQLNWLAVKNYCDTHGVTSFPGYIREVSGNGQHRRRIHGFKASWDQILMLMRFGIDRMYPETKVIHITRNDIVGQAVSLLIASQTNKWTSHQPGRAGVAPVYDEDRLTKIINACCESDIQVKLITQISGAAYLQVSYEEVVANPTAVMRRIGKFVGVNLSDWSPGDIPLKRQATSLNDEWRARYLAQARNTLLPEGPPSGIAL